MHSQYLGKDKSRSRGPCVLGMAILGILGAAGAAQAGQAPELEEIIVTAERRATSEQTTAISMDVLTGDALAETRTATINDLQNATPSLVVNTQGISQVVNIRGIGNSISSPNVTTGVGIYTDGLLAGEPQNIAGSMLDVDTVEVLRGPQGTFVGQASTGGAIRINSVRPNFNGTNGYVEGVYGDYNNMKVAGAVNLPISDTWAARIAFNTENRDSFFNNVGAQTGREPFEPLLQPGKVDARNIRASLLWQPNDSFSALARIDYSYTSDDGPSTQPNPRTFNSPVAGQPGVTIPLTSQYWAYDDPNHDPWVLYSNNLALTNTSTVYRYSLDMRYRLDSGYEFRSLSGMQNNLVRDVEDSDASSATTSPVQLNIGPESNYYTQEFTVVSPDAPLNWLAGTTWYYRQAPVTSGGPTYASGGGTSTSCGVQGSGAFVPCVTNPTILRYGLSSGRTIQRMGGVFGQLNYQFTDELQASVGARYSIDRNFNRGGGQRNPTAYPAGAPGIPPTASAAACPPDIFSSLPPGSYTCTIPAVTDQHYEAEEATWKVGLNWSPGGQGGDQFIYAFYARGYKPGGVNGNGRPFEEEQVDDYEIGWKGQVLDNRVQLSLGGYYMNYKNMQQSVWTAGTFGAASLITNIGESTIKGLEFEAKALLGNFTFGINSAYIDSKLGDVSVIDQRAVPGSAQAVPAGQNFAIPECTVAGQTGCFDYRGLNSGVNYYRDLSGISNVYSPELTYTLTADYSFDTGTSTWRPSVSWTHTDKQYTFLFQDDFFALDERNLLSVSLNYERDTWSGQLFCTNCSDKTYIAAMDSRSPYNVYYGAPRMLGLRVKKTF